MDDDVEIPQVAIRPFRCLSEASRLISGRYWLFVGLSAVAFLIGMFTPMGILMGPMMCGLALCYFRQQRGGEPGFDLLFKGFDHFVESLIASLLMVAAITACFVPIYLAFAFGMLALGLFPMPVAGRPPQPIGDPAFLAFFGFIFLVYTLILVVILFVSMLFAFVYPLIVDRQMKSIPAITTSFKAVLANFWGMLGLTLLDGLLSLLGWTCCGVGLILVLPITFGANIIAYRRIFPEVPLSPVQPDTFGMAVDEQCD
jgi:hypothetical protein